MIYTKEQAGGRRPQILEPKDDIQLLQKNNKEIEEQLEEVKINKELFTAKQLEDIQKIVKDVDKNKFMNSSSVGSAAIVGLAIAQLEYYANNNLNEEQKNNLMETVRKNYDVGISQLEKQQQLTNHMRDKMKEEVKLKYGWELQEYSPSFKETKKHYVLEQFKELDVTDEEAFQNAVGEYQNWALKGTGSNNSYLINSVQEEISILQNMWNSFRELI